MLWATLHPLLQWAGSEPLSSSQAGLLMVQVGPFNLLTLTNI